MFQVQKNFLGYNKFMDIHIINEDKPPVDILIEDPVLILSLEFFSCTSKGTGCIEHEIGEMSMSSCYFEKCHSLTVDNNRKPNVIKDFGKLNAQHIALFKCAPHEEAGDSPIRGNPNAEYVFKSCNFSHCCSLINTGAVFIESAVNKMECSRIHIEHGESNRVFYVQPYSYMYFSYFNVFNNSRLDRLFEVNMTNSNNVSMTNFCIFQNTETKLFYNDVIPDELYSFFSDVNTWSYDFLEHTSSTKYEINVVPRNQNMTHFCSRFQLFSIIGMCLIAGGTKMC